MTILNERSLWLGLGLASLPWFGAASAQDAPANPSRPAIDIGRNILDVETADIGGARDWSVALLANQAREAFVLESHAGITVPYTPAHDALVSRQTLVHLLGTYTATRWLELGVDLPLVVQQTGDTEIGRQDPSALEPGFGIGELRLQAKLHLFQTGIDATLGRIAFGTTFDVGLPTAREGTMRGSGGSFAPRAIVAWQTSFGPSLVANLGYTFRADTAVLNVSIPSGFAWELGVDIPIVDRARVMMTVVDDQALEASLGVAAHLSDVEAQASFTVGLDDSPATPAYRFGGAIVYRTGLSARDVDEDGRLDSDDHCPIEPEDDDGFEDDDGCPDPDNDEDAVADSADGCPLVAEDIDGHDDADGCPEFDNDADGTTDDFDRCPNEIEDRDGFEDQDGCPEPDNDRDGVADAADRCPIDAEDIDGESDEDGCPDANAYASIDTVIYFEQGSAAIRPEYRYELARVARTIQALPAQMHVWVEGYADDHGNDTHNVSLSHDRAQAVYDFLIERGVARGQLDIQAFGERTPAYVNESDQDRAVNRRVELRVGPRTTSDDGTAPPAVPAPTPAPAPAPSTGGTR